MMDWLDPSENEHVQQDVQQNAQPHTHVPQLHTQHAYAQPHHMEQPQDDHVLDWDFLGPSSKPAHANVPSSAPAAYSSMGGNYHNGAPTPRMVGDREVPNQPSLSLTLDARTDHAGYCNAGAGSESEDEPWWTSSSVGTATTPSPQTNYEPNMRVPHALHGRATSIPDIADMNTSSSFSGPRNHSVPPTGTDSKRRKLSLEVPPTGLSQLSAPGHKPVAVTTSTTMTTTPRSTTSAPASAATSLKQPPPVVTPSASSEPPRNRGRWTDEEHRLFLRGLNVHGRDWKAIANCVKSRSHVQIRTHAQKYFIKEQKSGATNINSSDQADTTSLLKRNPMLAGAAKSAAPASVKQEKKQQPKAPVTKQDPQPKKQVVAAPRVQKNVQRPASKPSTKQLGHEGGNMPRHLELPKVPRPASALVESEDLHNGHHKGGGRLVALMRAHDDQRAGRGPPGGNLVQDVARSLRPASMIGTVHVSSSQDPAGPEISFDDERDHAMLDNSIFLDDPMEGSFEVDDLSNLASSGANLVSYAAEADPADLGEDLFLADTTSGGAVHISNNSRNNCNTNINNSAGPLSSSHGHYVSVSHPSSHAHQGSHSVDDSLLL